MTADTSAVAISEEHSPVAHFSHDARGGISNPILGMVLFICSEVMFFSGLFAAYFTVRASAVAWPPIVEGDDLLTESFRLHDEPWFALILTIVLVLSSFTCQFAVWSIRRDDRTGFVRNIGITLVLGILFLIGQVYDYATLGFGISDGVFGTTFYTLTGFHGAHVSVGIIMLISMFVMSLRGKLGPEKAETVEILGLYWHFVDIVWILIFTIVYLIP